MPPNNSRNQRCRPRRQEDSASGCASEYDEGLGVEVDSEAIRALGDHVDSELTYEWQRKGSFETRAFATVTANLALVTLFLAISDRLQLLPRVHTNPSKSLILAALAASALSTASALVAAAPRNYPTPVVEAYDELLEDIKVNSYSHNDVAVEIVEARISQLSKAVSSNGGKARWSMGAFLLLGLAAALLAAALLTAV